MISCDAVLLKRIWLLISCSFRSPERDSPFICLIGSVVLLNVKHSTGNLFKVYFNLYTALLQKCILLIRVEQGSLCICLLV